MNSTKFTYKQYKYVIFNSYAPIFWAGGHNHRFVIWLKKQCPDQKHNWKQNLLPIVLWLSFAASRYFCLDRQS